MKQNIDKHYVYHYSYQPDAKQTKYEIFLHFTLKLTLRAPTLIIHVTEQIITQP